MQIATKRLVWIDSGGVRYFGCAGCKWTFPVQEFSPEFSEAELTEDFHHHSCDDPRFRTANAADLLPSPDSAQLSVDSSRILEDLCGLKGAVLASIESLSPIPSGGELAQIKAEIDRVRSLLWLHMKSSKT